MTDTDNNHGDVLDLNLARAVRSLDREIQPERDLWVGIERNIIHHPQRRLAERMQDWMPYGMAASMVLAVAALFISLNQVNSNPAGLAVALDPAMGEMKQEYLQVRNPMVEQFNQTNKDLDSRTLQDLHRNLEILELARRQIEEQVRQNPENTRLVEMLMRVHEQELDLLKRDFTDLSTTM